MSQNLPVLNPIPDDIEEHLQRLLKATLESPSSEPALGDWLLELIKTSGHLSNNDDLRWRILCMVWLAMVYDLDAAWPYLMWLNINKPVMSDHFSELLIEAIDNFEAHVQVANWQAQATDERLVTFFQDFRCIPAQRYLQPLFSQLFSQPTQADIGVWLKTFCEGTAEHEAAYMRPWRLLAAAWYAAAFNPTEGLAYLQILSKGVATLSPTDNKLLLDAAKACNGQTVMLQLIAACTHDGVKTQLNEFGHPHLPTLVATILDSSPAYDHLAAASARLKPEIETFQYHLTCLEQANISPKNGSILVLACGPLATQALLLSAKAYNIMGVDLDIPPGYLPLSGPKAWFKRNKQHKAWQNATAAYYQALAQALDLTLKWNKVKLKLADLTRLDELDHSFEAVICANHLHHAPDVNSLLAEAARVLKPGGLFMADIRPFAALDGAFSAHNSDPWSHLQQNTLAANKLLFNKWREAQFQAAIEKQFSLKTWTPTLDSQAQAQLTTEIRATLAAYEEAELTRQQIRVTAIK